MKWPSVILLLLSAAVPCAAVLPHTKVVGGYGDRPLAFEENRGQTDSPVRFLARGDGYGLFLTPTEAVLSLRGEDGTQHVLRLGWRGSFPAPQITGQEKLPGEVHSLKGRDPAGWRTGIPSYTRVRYEGVYPGTDILFYGRERRLEYDVLLAPGADPGRVRLAIEGADRLSIDPAGDLVLTVAGMEVRFLRPVSYQEVDGSRQVVASAYRLLEGGRKVGFEVGAYDRSLPLVIDPVLVYSTYLGGSGRDAGYGIATDATGNAYVTGVTASADFPVSGSPQPLRNTDVFVSKLDPSGGLVYSTYLGGSGSEHGTGITAGRGGEVYVTGTTDSADFPRVNPLQPPGGGTDAFVLVLNRDGSTLLSSTHLGGSGTDYGTGIGIDTHGHAYVTGFTASGDFPTVAALYPSRPGGRYDAFVTKLAPGGSRLVFSTYFGGSDWDEAAAIAVDGAGNAHVTGTTHSVDLPQVNPVREQQYPSGPDAFVFKLNPTGSALVYSGYLDGEFGEQGTDIAVDPAGNVYVTGYTDSGQFPIENALQPRLDDEYRDAFVTKLDPLGALVYSTYYGGTGYDWGTGIAADAAGNVYVTGLTSARDFPVHDPIQAQCAATDTAGCDDLFVFKLDPRGRTIVYSTYFGGLEDLHTQSETPSDIAVTPTGDVVITGWTSSPNFPTVNAFQPGYRGGPSEGFIFKISAGRPPVCSGATANPSGVWPPNGQLVAVSLRGVTDPDDDLVTVTVTGITQDEPLTGSLDAAGVGTATARVRASRDGKGDGRVYRIAFQAGDPDGGICTGTVTVCVPHDRGAGRGCRDGGAVVISTGS